MILHLIKPGSRGSDTVARIQQHSVARHVLAFGTTLPSDMQPEVAVLYDLPDLAGRFPTVYLGDGGELATELYDLPRDVDIPRRQYTVTATISMGTWDPKVDVWVVPGGTAPAKVALAMAWETLVITPAQPAYEELVLPGATGFSYVTMEEAQTLYRCLECDIIARQEVAARGRHWVRSTADIKLLMGVLHDHRCTVQ